MAKPSIILVPGSFCNPDYYDPLVAAVKARGVSMRAVNLLSAHKKPGQLPTLADDAANIASEVEKEADSTGADIVLVAHSYGGAPTSVAVKDIVKTKREAAGKKGGVVRLAYMTALVPAEGDAPQGELAEGSSAGEYMGVDEDGWMYITNTEGPAKMVFNDLPFDLALKEAEKFTQHSSASFLGPVTYPGYKDVPVSYLFCENDKCVPPSIQQRAIDHIEATGTKVDVTRIQSDHVPNTSHPEETVEWFVGLAEKSGSQ